VLYIICKKARIFSGQIALCYGIWYGLERTIVEGLRTDSLYIAGFVLLGDAALSEECAKELIAIAPEYDYILTAEAKGITLAHEMARQHGDKKHFVARKGLKVYMVDPISVTVHSITTLKEQTLYLDGEDAKLMKGKRILVVDDVISTGESLRAIEHLVELAGGEVCGRMTILAEGDAQDRDDLIYLEKLPLFNKDGQPI
jgi:adenine phosphoribosyltransferase